MSTRAIRAIRGDDALLATNEEEDESSDDDDLRTAAPRAFAVMALDDDDESSTDNESESSTKKDQEEPQTTNDETVAAVVDVVNKEISSSSEEEDEDLDALISEFQQHDTRKQITADALPHIENRYYLLVKDLDVRDMDIDWSMRLAVRDDGSTTATAPPSQQPRRRVLLFGPAARQDWPSPPRLVGGGIGMKSYDDDADAGDHERAIPWPYTTATDETSDETVASRSLSNATHWFSFVHSDTYQQDCHDYQVIQNSGDLNALVWFVIHHPYHCAALLQLSSVLYQSNHSPEGLLLLRRCLWTLESAALYSFARDHLNGRRMALIDADRLENKAYFRAMVKLVQVANIAGLFRTAFAVGRYILSLDSLRDPMGMLLSLDYYCLATNSLANAKWLVDLVDSNVIRLYYRHHEPNEEPVKVETCGLLALPNWAFSYALAKFRIYEEIGMAERKLEADAALQSAIRQFPAIIPNLLQANEVDVTGRSFRREWSPVLALERERTSRLLGHWKECAAEDAGTNALLATCQAVDVISRIFLQQNARLWASDSVFDFMYANLLSLTEQTGPETLCQPPCGSLRRYMNVDPNDFSNRVILLPEEANIVDMNLVAHALNVDSNRGRFLRRMRRDDANGRHDVDELPGLLHGIDPDLPLLEVFLRRVMGVEPPPGI